jgi:hypothetical protein
LKPLSVYKLSKVEAALRRLEQALDRLEHASIASLSVQKADPVEVDDAVPAVDAEEVAFLRQKCNSLSESLRAASLGVDVTVSRLKLLLED